MTTPKKYRLLGDFHKYYSGERRAPVLTIVVGGNHEASNYLFELYHGGWLAPNIYYLGAAGVVRYGPWRIAGLSGIYGKKYYCTSHDERLPYDKHTIRSAYHVREYDVQKLLSVTGHIDVALSHDWPAWIELFGDSKKLYAENPHFYETARQDGLGSKPATQLLDHLRPSYWFAGHMHVRFGANVQHTEEAIEETIRTLHVPEKLRSDLPVFKSQYTSQVTPAVLGVEKSKNTTTTFLAFDKVGQDIDTYLELLELNLPDRSGGSKYAETTADGRYNLYYDEEWLAITRAYNDTLLLVDPETLVVPPHRQNMPGVSAETIAQQQKWVQENVTAKGLLKIPQNFVAHAPFQSADLVGTQEKPNEYPNSQTSELAELLQMATRFGGRKTESFNGDDGDGIEFE